MYKIPPENIIREDISTTQMKVTIIIPHEVLQTYVQVELTELSKQVSIPGFRSNNIPHDILKKHVNMNMVEDDVKNQIAENNAPRLDKIAKVKMIGNIDWTFGKTNEGESTIIYTSDMVSKVDLPDYRAIAQRYRREPIELTQEDIDEYKKELSLPEATYSLVDRPIQTYDRVFLESTTVYHDGEELDMKEYVDIGFNQFFYVNDDFLLGLSPGQTHTISIDRPAADPDVQVPEDIDLESLYIKEIRLNLIEVWEPTIPEWNIEDDDGLRETIKNSAYRNKEKNIHRKLKYDMISAIADEADIDIPVSFIERASIMNVIEGIVEEEKFLDGVHHIMDPAYYRIEDLNRNLYRYERDKIRFKCITEEIYDKEKLEIDEASCMQLIDAVDERVDGGDFPEYIQEDEFVNNDMDCHIKQQKALDFLVELVPYV